MPIPVSGQVGEQQLGNGVTTQPLRQGQLADVIVTELQGRFYENNYRGRLYSGGQGLFAINNVTFTTGTLGATATPILGVWNPSTSKVNLVLLQATLTVTVTAATATGPGGFAWATSIGNAGISTGAAPFSRLTLANAGSAAKDMTNVALTGLTNNLVVRHASALMGGNLKNISSVETAVGQNIGQTGVSFENLDGSIIVPPGGVVALLAATTPVAHSALAGLLWAENPI